MTPWPEQSIRRKAFTLIELMVVIIVIMVIAAIGLTAFDKMRHFGQVEAAVNTISGAARLTRTMATRPVADLKTFNSECDYNGAAMIITPMNEIRIVENDQLAVSANAVSFSGYSHDVDQLLETIHLPVGCNPGGPGNNEAMNGYRDIPGLDYVRLPRGAGVAGIARRMPEELQLLQPPFALIFSDDGTVLSASRNTFGGRPRWVHYDANYDGKIICELNYQNAREYGCPIATDPGIPGSWRESPFPPDGPFSYNPDNWDPTLDEYDAHDDASSLPGIHPVSKRYKLPFEQIETALGIMVYSKNDFRAQGYNWDTGDPKHEEAVNWVLENGIPIFFNRYSGTAVKGGK